MVSFPIKSLVSLLRWPKLTGGFNYESSCYLGRLMTTSQPQPAHSHDQLVALTSS